VPLAVWLKKWHFNSWSTLLKSIFFLQGDIWTISWLTFASCYRKFISLKRTGVELSHPETEDGYKLLTRACLEYISQDY
jgi:hypothetical protein